MPTVKEIIKQYLEDNNWDGLFLPGRCACSIDDLFPCGEDFNNCQPGIKSECDCGDHDYHIGLDF